MTRWTRWLLLCALSVILGILSGFALVNAGIAPPTGASLGIHLLFLPATLYFVTLWHELGHALAAWLIGWRLLAIGVGPATLRSTPDGLRLSLNSHSALWGGQVLTIPSNDRKLRRRHVAIVVGGPFANLLLTLPGAVYMSTTDLDGLWPTLVIQIAIMSFMVSVLSLIPYRWRGLTSDGGQLLALLRGGPREEQRMAITLLWTALVGGVRPRDLDNALFTRALSATEPAESVGAHYLAYWRDLDRGDIPSAAAHLDRVLAERGVETPAAQASCAAEAAYLTARHDSSPDAPATAEAWLKLATPTGSVDSNYRRAQAAVHRAHGRAHEAQVAADDALRLLAHAMDIGGAEAEREWLAELRGEAVAGGGA